MDVRDYDSCSLFNIVDNLANYEEVQSDNLQPQRKIYLVNCNSLSHLREVFQLCTGL